MACHELILFLWTGFADSGTTTHCTFVVQMSMGQRLKPRFAIH